MNGRRILLQSAAGGGTLKGLRTGSLTTESDPEPRSRRWSGVREARQHAFNERCEAHLRGRHARGET